MKSLIESIKGKRMLSSIFFFYMMTVVIVVAIISCIVYLSASSKIRDEVADANKNVLSQVRFSADEFLLKKIDEILIDICVYNKNLFCIFNTRENDMQTVSRLVSDMEDIKNSYSFIESIYVLKLDDGFLISTEGCTRVNKYGNIERYLESLYDVFWLKKYRLAGNPDSMWLDTHNIKNIRHKGMNGDNVITLVKSFPSGSKYKQMLIAVNIYESEIFNILSRNPSTNDSIMLVGTEGNIISCGDKSLLGQKIEEKRYEDIVKHQNGYYFEKTEGKLFFVSYILSDYNNWIYLFRKPYADIFNIVEIVRTIIAVSCFAALLIGSVISICLAKRMYRPLKMILDMIQENSLKDTSGLDKGIIKTKWDQDYYKIRNCLIYQNEKVKKLEKRITVLAVNESNNKFNNIKTSDNRLDHLLKTSNNEVHNKNDMIAASIIDYISANISKDLTINDIARIIYMNPVYVNRIFKERTGITVTEYLYKVRMEKAIELLSCTNCKIEDIAKKLNYNAAHYFIKRFKEYYGMTPKEYRLTVGSSRLENEATKS